MKNNNFSYLVVADLVLLGAMIIKDYWGNDSSSNSEDTKRNSETRVKTPKTGIREMPDTASIKEQKPDSGETPNAGNNSIADKGI
jgi:hypothetical protein